MNRSRLHNRNGAADAWGGLPILPLSVWPLKWQPLVWGAVAAGMLLLWLRSHVRHKAALRRLSAERDRLQQQIKSILQSSREMVFGCDLQQRRFDYLSPAAFSLTGFSAEDLECIWSGGWIEHIHTDDQEAIRRLIGQIRQSGRDGGWQGTVECRFRHRDGRFCIFNGSLQVRFDEQGRPAYVSGSLRDATAIRQMEADLSELDKRFHAANKMAGLGMLAGGIAHDFNNLMTVVLGNTELALLERSGSSGTASLEEIKKTALRASELANQILVYSGKAPLTLSSINLVSVVREMGTLLDVSISKKVRMEYCLAEQVSPVCGDISQIRQVAMNLITNAAEAIGDHPGVIAISIRETDLKPGGLDKTFSSGTAPAGRYVQLEVSDTGCGMDAETMKKIFEPLFTTKVSGRGLGLASVFSVVQRHHGVITVESRPGEGTVFRVLLPAEEQEAGPEGDDSPAADTAPAWRGYGVALVADDEEAIRSIASILLERAGFHVVTAVDGQEAVEIFTGREDITLLVMDHNMPRMDGQEAVRRIRYLNPQVPVLLMSGYPREQVMTCFKDEPRIRFIKKPFQAAEMLNQVREILART